MPSYFKLYAENAAISQVIVTYSCSAPSSNNSVRLRINKPTVGGIGEISEDYNLWINTNILSSGSWQNYLMTKDSDGSYYYDFENVVVASNTYAYSMFLSKESETLTEWSYPGDDNPVHFNIHAGQNEVRVTGNPNFADQPREILESYD